MSGTGVLHVPGHGVPLRPEGSIQAPSGAGQDTSYIGVSRCPATPQVREGERMKNGGANGVGSRDQRPNLDSVALRSCLRCEEHPRVKDQRWCQQCRRTYQREQRIRARTRVAVSRAWAFCQAATTYSPGGTRIVDLVSDRPVENAEARDRLSKAANDLLGMLLPEDRRLLRQLGEEHQWPIVAMMLGAMAMVRAFPRGL
jgi:hypothetical protein